MSAVASRARRAIEVIKETWDEVDYAQRRLMEVQMGIPKRAPERPRIAMSVTELEELYAYDDPRRGD